MKLEGVPPRKIFARYKLKEGVCMINKINNKGFTLAEALVAMLLVAIMAAGIIVALMSTKRAIVAPTNREEMILAIEQVSSILQGATETTPALCSASGYALDLTPNCAQDDANSRAYCHNVACMRPNSCKGNNDYFIYSVSEPNVQFTTNNQSQKQINFMISCEGQTI